MSYERKTSDIFISEDLKDLLSKIEKQSAVAALLLKKRHIKDDLVDNYVNFISVSSDDRSKISYLTPDRAEAMEMSEFWTSKRRFHTKPGAFVSKIFKNISGRDVEIFSTLFRNISNRKKIEFKVVRGREIRRYYDQESYASENGSLGASCMKYERCQDYLGIYTENKEVSMLVMLDDWGGLIGRALLWDFDGHKIMDRIYTVSDEEYQFYFKEWAEKNQYLYKKGQNWFDTMNFLGNGSDSHFAKLEIKLENIKFNHYPYMDTFKFYCPKSGTISNYKPEEGSFYTMCASEGELMDGNHLVLDVVDNVFRYRNDAAYLNYISAWTNHSNAYYSEANDCYILKKDAIYDRETNDYLFCEEYGFLNKKEEKASESHEALRKYIMAMIQNPDNSIADSPMLTDLIQNQ